MPWKYTEEYYREYTRVTWNESAEAYVHLMRTLEPFRSDLVDAFAPKKGERLLDLGTGPGEPAMTLATATGPTGHVVGVDLSEKMIDLATRVAAARGLANVRFQVMDCAALDFPDGSFDGAISSLGFQIFTDPEKAAREARRVLAPNGRIAAAVWSTGDKTPFLEVLVGPMLKFAEPDETGYTPTPYETGGPGEMVAFLEAAGFREAKEQRNQYRMTFPDEESYLDSILRGTPIGHSLREEERSVQDEILATTRENLRKWKTPAGITLPAEGVIVVARA